MKNSHDIFSFLKDYINTQTGKKPVVKLFNKEYGIDYTSFQDVAIFWGGVVGANRTVSNQAQRFQESITIVIKGRDEKVINEAITIAYGKLGETGLDGSQFNDSVLGSRTIEVVDLIPSFDTTNIIEINIKVN